MVPLFFGQADQAMYGVYHPALGAGSARQGVVICNPLLHEAIWCNRPYRVLAEALVRQRYHVFRFDYIGTGDSLDGVEDLDVSDWPAQVGLAIDELKSIAGLDSVDLIGLRLGANIALETSTDRTDVDELVLWDPIVQGSDYLQELGIAPGANIDAESNGFPFPRALQTSLAAVDLTRRASEMPEQTMTIFSGENPERYGDLNLPGEVLKINGPEAWSDKDSVGAGAVPGDVIQVIVDSRSPKKLT